MRHAKLRHQLNRFTSWRRATLSSMVRSLLIHQSIKTTKTKALAAKSLADKLISLAKDNTLSAKRQAYRILGEHRLVSLLFNDIALRFDKKSGGYTRILNLGSRRGDNAKLAVLELTEIRKKEKRATGKKKEAKPTEEKIIEAKPVREVPPAVKRPSKNFLGNLRNIFKKERDSL